MVRGEDFDLDAGTREFYQDANYYDFEFRARRADVRWYVQRYLAAEGPVLELAVGSGRIALRAVRQGASVVGVDFSRTMLARAEQQRKTLPKARRGALELHYGDMRDLDLGRRFKMVSCPFNAFMHLYTVEDVDRCLQTVRRHLEPGGLFVFDVMFPDMEYLLRPAFKRYPGIRFLHPTLDLHYIYSEQSAWDPVRQLCQMWFWYTLAEDDPPEGAAEEFSIQLSHRYFWPQELQALLEHNGFEPIAWYGDFDGNELCEDAESMIVMAAAR